MNKKLLCLIISIIMILSTANSVFSYSINDAFDECSSLYPEFISTLNEHGVSNEQIIALVEDTVEELQEMNESTPVVEGTFEQDLITALTEILNFRKHIVIRNALTEAYTDAVVVAAIENRIADDFIPLYNTISNLFFDNDMLNSDINDTEENIIITAISSINDMKVSYNTVKDLPTTVTATTNEENTISLTITWSGTYNPKSSGKQEISGTVTIPDGYVLDANLSETVKITVNVGQKALGGDTIGTSDDNDDDDDDDDSKDTENKKDDATTPDNSTDNKEDTVEVISFTDIADVEWAHEAINALVKNKVINGYTDGSFRPNNFITRAEFAKIITTAANLLEEDLTSDFTDVNDDDWFAPYIACAKKNQLITGYEDGSFRPNDYISRADISVIVYRYLIKVNPELENKEVDSINVFADDSDIPSYAKQAVYAMQDANIISGMGNMMFAPLQNATRAQAAKILFASLEYVK